jgi:hypothetical protein
MAGDKREARLRARCPGHPRFFRTRGTKDVDIRDIGAKQSFIASPGHDEPPDGQITSLA